MTIPASERHAWILRVVQQLGTVRVVDLADRLGTPAVTLRRDIAALAAEGRLHRTHGAVTAAAGPPAEPAGQRPVIGMLVPTVGSYFDEIVAGARAAAGDARLVLGIAGYETRDDRAQVEHLLGAAVDGLLLSPNWGPGDRGGYGWLRELPVPAVLIERRAAPGGPGSALDAVASDHRHGVLIALRHLAALGHRSVLLAARDDTCTAHEIRAGYRAAAGRLGLEALPILDIPVAADGAAAGGESRVAASEDGSRPERATPGIDRLADRIAEAASAGVRAVLVHNDRVVIHLPMRLRARGLRVPEDLVLISYDDVFAALADPPLTAVAPPRRSVGATAMGLLLRRIGGEARLPAHRIDLLPGLKIRGSCGGSAEGDRADGGTAG